MSEDGRERFEIPSLHRPVGDRVAEIGFHESAQLVVVQAARLKILRTPPSVEWLRLIMDATAQYYG